MREGSDSNPPPAIAPAPDKAVHGWQAAFRNSSASGGDPNQRFEDPLCSIYSLEKLAPDKVANECDATGHEETAFHL